MRETPHVNGQLINLSADSIIDENDPQQQPYYLAIIEITDEGLRHLADNDLTLVAGMPAEVFIKTGERTLFQYLPTPWSIRSPARSSKTDTPGRQRPAAVDTTAPVDPASRRCPARVDKQPSYQAVIRPFSSVTQNRKNTICSAW